MAKSNFATALPAVLAHEGGYVDHPEDPGGATNMGITHKTLARWRGVVPWWSLGKGEVKALTRDEAAKIYKANYWDDIRGDDLPAGLDYAVFDYAVNSGPGRASITLQNIVGTAPDGEIGSLTLKAITAYVDKFGAAQLINELCSQRLAFLERLSTWPTFGKGWRSRVNGVRELASKIAAATPVPTVELQPAPPPETAETAALRRHIETIRAELDALEAAL